MSKGWVNDYDKDIEPETTGQKVGWFIGCLFLLGWAAIKLLVVVGIIVGGLYGLGLLFAWW
jgi:hypothetical protein